MQSEGFILRQIPYSESSIIAKIFTREAGLLSFHLKGIKSRKNNSQSGLIRPMNKLFLSFNHRENQSLKSLRDIQLLFAPDSQLFGIHKSAILMFIFELLNQTIREEGVIDTDKFDFIQDAIQALIDREVYPSYYLQFMYQYAVELGIGSPMLEDNLAAGLEQFDTTQIYSSAQRKDIYLRLSHHYEYHIPGYKPVQSIGILNVVLS